MYKQSWTAVSMSHQPWLPPSDLLAEHFLHSPGGTGGFKKRELFGNVCRGSLVVIVPVLSQIQSRWWVGWRGFTLRCLNSNLQFPGVILVMHRWCPAYRLLDSPKWHAVCNYPLLPWRIICEETKYPCCSLAVSPLVELSCAFALPHIVLWAKCYLSFG